MKTPAANIIDLEEARANEYNKINKILSRIYDAEITYSNLLKEIADEGTSEFSDGLNYSKIINMLREYCGTNANYIKDFAEIIMNNIIDRMRNIQEENYQKAKEIQIKLDKEKENLAKQTIELGNMKDKYLNSFEEIDQEMKNYKENYNEKADNKNMQIEYNRKIFKLYENYKNREIEYLVRYYSVKKVQQNDVNDIAAISYNNLDKNRFQSIREQVNSLLEKTIYLNKKLKELGEKLKFNIKNYNYNEAMGFIKPDLNNLENLQLVQEANAYETAFKKLESCRFFRMKIDDKNLCDPHTNVEESIPTVFSIILNTAWYTGEYNGMLDIFKTHVGYLQGRSKFCDVLKMFRIRGHSVIPGIGYFAVAKLLEIALNKANDLKSISTILIMSQTYYSTITRNKEIQKIFLYEYI